MRIALYLAFSTFFVLGYPNGLYSQSIAEINENPNPNFYEIRDAWLGLWKPNDSIKPGYKQFKRWEWFWEQRVDASGAFPAPDVTWNAVKKERAQARAIGNNRLAKVATDKTWRLLGPSVVPERGGGAGRLNCVRPSQRNPKLIWVGSASGGAWKTTNGGDTWQTTTDELLSIGIGDIAFNDQDPSTVFLATGDANNRDTYSIGVVKSTDGGMTWTETDLKWETSQTRRISRLIMPQSQPNVLLAATSVGVLKSSDAGQTWKEVRAGVYRDMELRPDNDSIVYAATAKAIFRSRDMGETWETLSSGIPDSSGRIALAVTAANPDFVYAVSAGQNAWGFAGLFLSRDGGNNWTRQSIRPNLLNGEPDGLGAYAHGWYDLSITSSPINANHVYVGGINTWRSLDAGLSWQIVSHWYGANAIPYVHADIHDLTFASDGKLYSANDGGLFFSADSGRSWVDKSKGLEITQFYAIASSPVLNDFILGGTQDNGTNRMDGSEWVRIRGGDGMVCLVDPENPFYLFASVQNGGIQRSIDGGENFQRSIDKEITGEEGAWVTPLKYNPQNSNTVFAAYYNVWRSTDIGLTWRKVTSRPANLGTISQLTVAKADSNVWYFSASNRLYRTLNAGDSIQDVGSPQPGVRVTEIFAGFSDPLHVVVALSTFSGRSLFLSKDGGQTWQSIAEGLPEVPVLSFNVINEERESWLVGTDIGVYYRDSASSTWQRYGKGLPNVVVTQVECLPNLGLIRIGTYGRGIWEIEYPESDPNLAESFGGPRELSVYPNPVSSLLTISPTEQSVRAMCEIYAEDGGLLYRETIPSLGERHSVDVGAMPSGRYLLVLYTQKSSYRTLFVKH